MLRLVEKLRTYKYKAENIKGEKNIVADTLSRAPVDKPTEEDQLAEEVTPQVRGVVRRAVSCAGVVDDLEEALGDPKMEWLKRAAAVDEAYQELLQTVRQGFPENKDEIPKSVLLYFPLREE